jgi:hypothetical protein
MAHLTQDKNGVFYLTDEWHIEDVQSVRDELNQEQCEAVLEAIVKNHDACVGINWDVIEDTIELLYPAIDEPTEEES